MIFLLKTRSKRKAIDVVLANWGCILWKKLMKWTIGCSFNLLLMIRACLQDMEKDTLVAKQGA